MRTVSWILLAVPIALAGCTHGGGSGGGSTSVASTASSSAPPTATGTPGNQAPTPRPAPARKAPANLTTGPSLVLDASGNGAFFDLPFPLDSRRTNGVPDLSA